MRLLQVLLVLLYGLMFWYEVRTGLTEYAAFKLLVKTSDRQRHYRIWVLRSLLLFTGSAALGLFLLRRWQTLSMPPAEFATISAAILRAAPGLHFSKSLVAGLLAAVCAGAVLGGLIAAKSADKGRSLMAGDIEPLMPRNWAETGYTFVLSLSAGLGEELMFRLFLPLLLTLVSGSVVFGFVAAGIAFGVMHLYQGLTGILVTMVLGFGFAALYLTTGSIWIVASIHAGLDVLGIVVRPTIVRLLRARGSGAAVAELR